MLESYKATNQTANGSALENRRLLKAAMTGNTQKPELSQFAINSNGPSQPQLQKTRSNDIDASIRDIPEIVETKPT